jgi:YbbR domain-containing protein
MTWLVTNWRLKLLALVLTLGLLAAVAFSENPLTVRTVQAVLDYEGLPSGLAVENPPSRVSVNVFGLSSSVNLASENTTPDIHFHLDLAKAKAGPNQVFYAAPKTLPPNVNWTGDPVQVTLTIDAFESVTLTPIELRTPHVDPGIKVLPDKSMATCGNSSEACRGVTVNGPARLLSGLKAYVEIDSTINTDAQIPTQPVRFERDGVPIDLAKQNYLPSIGWTPSVVDVTIATQRSQGSRQVALRVNVTGRPACGFQASSLDITGGGVVQLSGPLDAIAKVPDSIALPQAVDITGARSPVSVRETVPTDPNVSASPAIVTVTVGITQAFDCSAPTPTPAPSPSPH